MATKRGVKLFAVCVLGGLSASAGAEPAFTPRTLANGRPACGNIVGKGPRRASCETATPIVAQTPVRAEPARPIVAQAPVRVEPATPVVVVARPAATAERIDWRSYIDTAAVAASTVIKPRLLRSGRPACGNTGGKAPEPRECSMTDVIVEQQPDLEAELARL